MRRLLLCVFFLCGLFCAKAQKNNHFNVVFGGGASYFLNDKSLNRALDNTLFAGINYEMGRKKQLFYFNPGLVLQLSDYHSKLSNARKAHVEQRLLTLNLDVLMRTGKRSIWRVGLFLSHVNYSNVSISQKLYNANTYISYGSSEIEKGYSPTLFQTGINLGFSIPFTLVKREQKFHIKIVHYASSVSNSNYIIPKSILGQDATILTVKARPTQLVFGFDVNLVRLKKKKQLEEE